MRVLIVNKFWYARGGDCVVAMGTVDLLRRMGHDVEVFSMHHPNNVECDYTVTYAPEVHFDGNLVQKIRAMVRAMSDRNVRNSFTATIERFHPDVVHLHNIHSYLSPLVAQIAHEHGCRVVWTMHDYKVFCPSYSCLRNGTTCDSCIEHPMDVVVNRCMKDSLIASIAALLESTKWNVNKLAQYVDKFICPSQFMAKKLKDAGISSDKLAVITNFLPDDKRDTSSIITGRADYCCYIGRISHEKGIETMLDAASTLPFTLKVAGNGPMLQTLKEKYAHCKNIEFLGLLDSNNVTKLLRLTRFSVMPSQWWENNPLSIIESLCAGTPVVGTDIGGIPELIDNSCGILVPTGDVKALANAMQEAWDMRWDHAAIARHATSRFSPTVHYQALTEVYHP
ncbi:MAG: glycosyltransferase [Muribaculaceae bacterium]|nr:glycosyltransferase [Muribaculaceae bacterium]